MPRLLLSSFSNTSDYGAASVYDAHMKCLQWASFSQLEGRRGLISVLKYVEDSERSWKSTWQSLHGFVGSSVGAELIEKMATGQLEIANQRWWELPIQPSTESLHPLIGFCAMPSLPTLLAHACFSKEHRAEPTGRSRHTMTLHSLNVIHRCTFS